MQKQICLKASLHQDNGKRRDLEKKCDSNNASHQREYIYNNCETPVGGSCICLGRKYSQGFGLVSRCRSIILTLPTAGYIWRIMKRCTVHWISSRGQYNGLDCSSARPGEVRKEGPSTSSSNHV